MSTITSAAPRSATASGQPRWFFGGLLRIRASAHDTNGRYTLAEVECPPGLQAPLHVHHTEDEGFHVLEGSITLEIAEESVELAPGSHAFGPRDIPHRYTVGPDGVRMLWILVPGGFEDFVDEASVPAESLTLPPPEVVPPADVAQIALRHGKELLGS
jgi:mannose-6-phosphate isomerase-like protein (cupin superfamily)